MVDRLFGHLVGKTSYSDPLSAVYKMYSYCQVAIILSVLHREHPFSMYVKISDKLSILT